MAKKFCAERFGEVSFDSLRMFIEEVEVAAVIEDVKVFLKLN
jgi:hypothetical protein